MAVEGTIGGQPVILDNAATESTLEKIFKLISSSFSPEKLKEILGEAGLDETTVKKFTQEVSLASKIAGGLGGALGGLDSSANTFKKTLNSSIGIVGEFTNNLGNTSGLFGQLAQQQGVVGAFGRTFQLVADFNEKQLGVYQQLTTAGINFGGSLGDLRTSAAAMELSMDQFVGLMKNNSEAFAKMGSNANDGAQNFKKLSQAMFAGDTGNKLKSLGYTSEQVNQSMINYIAFTGGRSAKEMQNTGALVAASQNYMKNLDALATITGKSREQQEEAMKEAAANQAWQSYLMTLTEDERNKAIAGMNAAFAYGGEGAKQAFMAGAQGLPPMIKSAQMFVAMSGNMNEVTNKQIAGIKDSTVSLEEMNRTATEYNVAAIEDKKNLEGASAALIMGQKEGSEQASATLSAANRAQQAGATSNAKAISQLDAVLKEQEKRQESTAARQVEIQNTMRKAGEVLLNALVPLAERLLPVIESIVSSMAGFLDWLDKTPGAFETLSITVASLAGTFVVLKTAIGAKKGWEAVSGLFGGGGGKGGIPNAGNIGDDIGKFTKGAGPASGGILTGVATGLQAFGKGAGYILLGAAVLAGSIAIIGVGIAAASWIMGAALPTLAEGLMAFGSIDGNNLVLVGAGVGALGLGLLALAGGQAAKGSVDFLEGLGKMFGGQTTFEKLKDFASIGPGLELAGKGLTAFIQALNGLTNINTDKLDRVSVSMAKLKQSMPRPSLIDMAGEVLVNLTKPITQVAEAIIPVNPQPSSNNININDLISVNTQMLAVMKDVVKQQQNTISTLKGLSRANW